MKGLPDFIEKLRTSRGMSQNEVATRAGVNSSVVCRLEQGETHVRGRTLQKILKALGVRPGSADYVEATALLAADTALGSDAVTRPAVLRRYEEHVKAFDKEETKYLAAMRALTPAQRDTIEMLLENPAAIDGLNAMLYARLPKGKKRTKDAGGAGAAA